MTHGSLFSGIGGFDIGFQWAGIETIWQVEIDDYCLKVLERHFPDAKRFSDIKKVGAHNLEKVDIISGGFPCQDISIAGKRTGITGSRSGLWSEMFRVIGELRPRFAVIENVPNLVKLGLDRVLIDLASIGYDAEWQIISARDLGAWHLRKRIWIVAYPKSQRRALERAANQRQGFRKIDPLADAGKTLSYPDQIHDDNPGYGTGKVRGERQEKTKIQRHISDSTVQRLPDWAGKKMEQPYPIVERDFRGMAYGISHRVDRLKALGNAIVPQIAEIIGKLIMESTSVNPHT